MAYLSTRAVGTIGLVLGLAFSVGGCQTTAESPQGSAAEETAGAPDYIALDQGWNDDLRKRFWFTDQGSQIVPYKWFLALETANNEEPFRSDHNLSKLGYLPKGPSALNPDGLPVGFGKAVDSRDGSAWMGLTCAACHTGQVNYRGVRIRIDGGQTLGDFNRFVNELIGALQGTRDDATKFQRFVVKTLGSGAGPQAEADLRQALQARTAQLENRLSLQKPTYAVGPARVDAIGNIFNEVLVNGLGVPENGRPPAAPVSYPFLWDTPQHDVVQWNGVAPNIGVGPLLRNVGEVLGVFGVATVALKKPRRIPRRSTSII